jgi:hypothetical protein
MAQVIAPTALAALELSNDPVHARSRYARHPATVRNFTLETAFTHAMRSAPAIQVSFTGRARCRRSACACNSPQRTATRSEYDSVTTCRESARLVVAEPL